jgi:hypothetical protein
VFLGNTSWVPGRPGDSWSHPAVFARQLDSNDSLPHTKSNEWAKWAQINAELHSLGRSLDAFQVTNLSRHHAALETLSS